MLREYQHVDKYCYKLLASSPSWTPEAARQFLLISHFYPLKCSYKLSYLSIVYHHCYSQQVALLPISLRKSGHQLRDSMSSASAFGLKTQLYLYPAFLLSQRKRDPPLIYALDPSRTCCLSKTLLQQYVSFLSMSSLASRIKKMLKFLPS